MLDDVLNMQARLGQYKFPVYNLPKENYTANIIQPIVKEKSWKQAVVPACSIGGGAILMYLGFKTPGTAEKIQQLYKQKFSNITNEINTFRLYAQEYLDKEYKKILPYINSYRKEHSFEYIGYTAKIQDSQNGTEVLKAVDEAFSDMDAIRAKDHKTGVSGMDEFKNFMYDLNYYAYEHLTAVRKGASIKLVDNSLMPRFQNGKHEQTMQTMEEKLGKIKVRADKKLFDIQNNITDDHINLAAKAMARNILRARRNLQNSSESIMDYTFEKFVRIYDFGSDFKPLSKTGRSVITIGTIPPEKLHPQPVSESVSKIIKNPYIKNLLETTDFSELNKESLKTLFNSMPSDFDTKQMDILTDRIRLQQAINTAQQKPEDLELKTISAKLEYLAANLESCGQAEIIARCSRDFSKMNYQQIHANLYYINSAAKKIGLIGLEDVDKFMIEKCPDYLDSTFKQKVNEFLAHPEHYFM